MIEPEPKWPRLLVLVRHGESERNVALQEAKRTGAESYGGNRRDMSSSLTERGRAQAAAVG